VSSSAFNGKTSLMLCCPMTTQRKGYLFEVAIAGARPSAALADQVKSLDGVARNARYKGKVSTGDARGQGQDRRSGGSCVRNRSTGEDLTTGYAKSTTDA
jgi:hypothetical protein